MGANYSFPLSDSVETMVLAEWAGIRNSGGGSDDVNYITTSLGFTILDNWNFAASYTKRDTEVFGGTDIDDDLYQISAGYVFDNGFSIDIGYKAAEEAGVDTNVLGGLLAYSYEF